MELDLNSATLRPVTRGLFDAVLGRDRKSQASGAYCCVGCGEEITFDSLAATCSCSQECYSAGSACADSVETHH